MRTNEEKKKEKVKVSEVGTSKAQFKTRCNTNSNKDVPEIRLCGNWLEKLGFYYGKKVSVTTRKKVLIIKLQAD
jgi:hypothetical protein